MRCEVADATALPYTAGAFGAAIFAFNGLLMIPGPGRREAAMREIARVLRPGGIFVFSGHDRTATRAEHWRAATCRWEAGEREPGVDRLGDTLYDTPQGRVFIHSAAEEELVAELAVAGLDLVFSEMRSRLADEPPGGAGDFPTTRACACACGGEYSRWSRRIARRSRSPR